MPFANTTNPFAQYLDEDGNPYSGGSVGFYESGTTTLKAIYLDSAGSVEAENPQPLDAGGYYEQENIWAGLGAYKVILYDALGAEIRSVDPVVWVSGSDSAAIDAAFVETINDLYSIDGDTNELVWVSGYLSAGDLGGGWFRWDATSSATPNYGSVFSVSPIPAQGRWLRVFEGSDVLAQQFGAIPDQTANPCDTPIANAQAFCFAEGRKLVFGAGRYVCATNVNFYTRLRIDNGAYIDGLAPSINVTFAQPTEDDSIFDIDSATYIVGNNAELFFSSPFSEVDPIWWQSSGLNSTQAWVNMSNNTTNVGVLLNRTWSGLGGFGGVDVEVNRLILGDNGYINLSSGTGSLIIGDIIGKRTIGNYVFAGSLDRLAISGKTTDRLYEDYFFSSLSKSRSSYGLITIAVTNGATEAGELWFRRSAVAVDDAVGESATAISTLCVIGFEVGGKFSNNSTSLLTIGSIVDETAGTQILNGSSNIFTSVNSANAWWWGDTTNAIVQAIGSASRVVDLGGRTYTGAGITLAFNVRNGSIVASSDVILSSATLSDVSLSVVGDISFSSTSTVKDCVITCTGSFLEGGSSALATIENSTIIYGGVVAFEGVYNIRNCRITCNTNAADVELGISTSRGVFSGNEFVLGSSVGVIVAFEGTSLTIANNVFRGGASSGFTIGVLAELANVIGNRIEVGSIAIGISEGGSVTGNSGVGGLTPPSAYGISLQDSTNVAFTGNSATLYFTGNTNCNVADGNLDF